jgi:hypothetical protein
MHIEHAERVTDHKNTNGKHEDRARERA